MGGPLIKSSRYVGFYWVQELQLLATEGLYRAYTAASWLKIRV